MRFYNPTYYVEGNSREIVKFENEESRYLWEENLLAAICKKVDLSEPIDEYTTVKVIIEDIDNPYVVVYTSIDEEDVEEVTAFKEDTALQNKIKKIGKNLVAQLNTALQEIKIASLPDIYCDFEENKFIYKDEKPNSFNTLKYSI